MIFSLSDPPFTLLTCLLQIYYNVILLIIKIVVQYIIEFFFFSWIRIESNYLNFQLFEPLLSLINSDNQSSTVLYCTVHLHENKKFYGTNILKVVLNYLSQQWNKIPVHPSLFSVLTLVACCRRVRADSKWPRVTASMRGVRPRASCFSLSYWKEL